MAVPLTGYDYHRDPRPQPRGEALMRSAVLRVHNDARRLYGVAPIGWDEALARDARVYARTLARSGAFKHDPQTGVRPKQGENLWMGTRHGYKYEEMVQSMVDERANFRPGRFPDVSRSGKWWEVGHYTQIVWPTTTRVGCALESNKRNDFLVCRYLPGGNVIGTPMR